MKFHIGGKTHSVVDDRSLAWNCLLFFRAAFVVYALRNLASFWRRFWNVYFKCRILTRRIYIWYERKLPNIKDIYIVVFFSASVAFHRRFFGSDYHTVNQLEFIWCFFPDECYLVRAIYFHFWNELSTGGDFRAEVVMWKAKGEWWCERNFRRRNSKEFFEF